MEPAPLDDATLVREILDGDQAAFRDLVERYQDRMFAMVRHFTRNGAEVEDIVQETFLKAFSRLDTFQQQASFSTWLHRIAVNTSLDFLKRRGRNPVRAVEDPELAAGDPGDLGRPGGPAISAPHANLEAEEIARITHEVLDELPDIFRQVLVMREFEEMAYQEMADVLGISIGTIESRLFRARARFREKLARLYPEFGAR